MVYLICESTMEDFDVLRELSIRTYYETFAHLNTAEDMQACLDEAFEIHKLREELNNPDSFFSSCTAMIRLQDI